MGESSFVKFAEVKMVAKLTLFALLGLVALCTSWFLSSNLPRTNFTLEGRFHCAHRGAWCFKFWLAERDTFKDDPMDSFGVFCQEYGASYPFHAKGWDQGDGLYDNYYEIVLIILHNCNMYAKASLMEIHLDPIPITTINYTKKFIRPVELFGQGKIVSREDYPIH